MFLFAAKINIFRQNVQKEKKKITKKKKVTCRETGRPWSVPRAISTNKKVPDITSGTLILECFSSLSYVVIVSENRFDECKVIQKLI